jgi:hypothetical protein
MLMSWFIQVQTVNMIITVLVSCGPHGCGEQWQHKGHKLRVYTSLGLHEDKNPTSYVCCSIMICWVETPSTPPFID